MKFSPEGRRKRMLEDFIKIGLFGDLEKISHNHITEVHKFSPGSSQENKDPEDFE
jgi:hypothetical protein